MFVQSLCYILYLNTIKHNAVPRFLSFLKGANIALSGIDIGSSAVKVVQIRQEKGIAILETYGSLAIGPYVEGAEIGQHANANEEVLHTVLSALLQEAKVTASLACASIPFHSSLISLIEVPALSDEKIAQTIRLKQSDTIPVPLEDVSLDWFVVPQALLSRDDAPIFEDESKPATQEEKRKVLLIAIHNHELVKHKNILSKIDLNTQYFEIEIFSTLRSSVYDGGLQSSLLTLAHDQQNSMSLSMALFSGHSLSTKEDKASHRQ